MVFGRKQRRIVRLLIVEDEPLVAFDTEHFLREEDFEIVGTVDGASDAIALLSDGRAIDLVLVDVSLADGNGIEVARAAFDRGVAAMFVTGNCPAGGEAVALGCLAKPYPQRALLAAIEAIDTVLDGNAPPRRLPAGFRLFTREAA
jgi:DNA-binding response OmpR family regulator